MNDSIKNNHPEVKNLENICEISPKTKNTEEVCDKTNEAKKDNKKEKKESPSEKKTHLDDSANPGNQYSSENRQPKNMEKKGFNNFAKTVIIKK